MSDKRMRHSEDIDGAPTADGSTAPRRTPQVAVVGCGHWGSNLVRNFAALGALAAVCDFDAAAAARAASLAGVTAANLSDVLSDEQVEAVIVATPASTHAAIAHQSLSAGKHVFVEKPLALDVDQAEKLTALAEEGSLTLMVGHLLQYHPAFTRLRTLVHDGDVGRLRYVYSNRLNFGRFRREENILWSFAPHDISMILSLVGAEPDQVSAVGSSFLHKSIADVTTTHLSFPAGESAHIFVSWLHPFKEQKLVVVGEKAMAVFDDSEPWERKLCRYQHEVAWRNGLPEASKAMAEPIDLSPAEPLELECRHFLRCVSTGARPRTDGADGLRVLRVLDAAQAALLGGNETPAGRAYVVGTSTHAGRAPMIHSSSFIDEPCVIGSGTKIWHFSHILAGTTIGRDCVIGQNVMIGPDVVVGDRCKIQNNVSLYPGVTLEDGVFCGPSAVFTNVKAPRAEVDRREEFAPTLVRGGATIGANATIVCGTTLGAYSFIAAGAVITRDVPAHALMVGAPARRVGWVSHEGEPLGDDLVCPRSGRRYVVVDGTKLEESFDDNEG